MGGFPFRPEEPPTESEPTPAKPDVEEYLAAERHNAVFRKHIMGLIEACRARLPGVDGPAS